MKLGVRMQIGFGSGQNTMMNFLHQSNKPSGSIRSKLYLASYCPATLIQQLIPSKGKLFSM
jgi:hypothetical protein